MYFPTLLTASWLFCDALSNTKGSPWKNVWWVHTQRKKKKALYALIQLYTVYICHSFSFAITHFTQDLRHLKCSRGVHVGSDDGDASVALFGVAECERPLKVHLRGTGSD